MRGVVSRIQRRVLQPIGVKHAGGGHRIEADVDGVPLWFESPDVVLRADVEPFVVALLFPAMRWGRSLRADQPLDAKLLEGLRSLARTYSRWWGYPADVVKLLCCAAPGRETTPPQVGLCFSGGVDSFYSLLTCDDRPDRLIFVHGFDIPLADTARWRRAERDFRACCEELAVPGAVVRTNLRQHPVFRKVSWEHAHGAALAAVGHALSGAIGTLRIPPSVRGDRLRPWGSDPRTDPLYSSARLRIVHRLSMDVRLQRIARIAPNPVVQRYLRVCYENRCPTGNCSSCEKCLFTMMALAAIGRLQFFEVFDSSVPLQARLDALSHIPDHLFARWKEFAELSLLAGLSPEMAAAIKRLTASKSPIRRTPLRRLQRWWRTFA